MPHHDDDPDSAIPADEHLQGYAWYRRHLEWLSEGDNAVQYRSAPKISKTDFSGLDLRDAQLSRFTARHASFRAANLSGASLEYANVEYADFSSANLRGVDIRGARMTQCNFYGADLRGFVASDETIVEWATLIGAKGIATRDESIKRLDAIRERIVVQGAELDMDDWHADAWSHTDTPAEACGTAHCLAGWAQALDPRIEVRRLSAMHAGILLIPLAASLFLEDRDFVYDWLKDSDYTKGTSNEAEIPHSRA